MGVDPIAADFPFVSPYNFAENRVIDGIDLWGLQYVNANESFYNVSMGHTWLRTNRVFSSTDSYGIPYTGMSIPIQAVDFGVEAFPLYSPAFARSLSDVGANLNRMYSETPKTLAKRPDRRYNVTKAFEKSSNRAKSGGKVGLSLVALDFSIMVYNAIEDLSAFFSTTSQLRAIENSWFDVSTALNEGLIDQDFQNVNDLSRIANYLYQGADQFGDNEELRNTAKTIWEEISIKNIEDE